MAVKWNKKELNEVFICLVEGKNYKNKKEIKAKLFKFAEEHPEFLDHCTLDQLQERLLKGEE